MAVLKDCPSLVKRNTFVDPVCFVLWEGDICHSFCYRTPKTVSLIGGAWQRSSRQALQVLLYYFIAAEVGIANYIQRVRSDTSLSSHRAHPASCFQAWNC